MRIHFTVDASTCESSIMALPKKLNCSSSRYSVVIWMETDSTLSDLAAPLSTSSMTDQHADSGVKEGRISQGAPQRVKRTRSDRSSADFKRTHAEQAEALASKRQQQVSSEGEQACIATVLVI